MNLNIDIGDKLKSRLLKFYKYMFSVKGKSGDALVDGLFWLKNQNLQEYKELLDYLFIGKHDQITEFIKNGLENNFSVQDISEFIISNGSMFPDGTGGEFDVGEEKLDVRFVGSKSSRVMKFLLLILGISQDKNFCSLKQELTIDYILELAKDITDCKLRCQFKMAAISYFLPDDNEYIKSHLSSVMSDMQKLFAQELSDDNNKIEMEYKFGIKYKILNMLTAKRNLIRKDIANFDMGEDSNFMRTFDPWTSPVKKIVENNKNKITFEHVRYDSYAYYHDCLPDDVLRRRNNLRDGNFEDQSTQEPFVIANDLNEIDESEDENEINDIASFIKDDIKNFKNPDGEINFVDDDADDIKTLLLIWNDDDYPKEKKSAGLNNILDFAADYIKKLVDDKSKYLCWFTEFLFFDIRNLFSDEVLLKKIDELLKENEHNQNDYKIFTLVLALLQNNNDGLHYLGSFITAEQFADKTTLQKKLDTKMKFKLLNFIRKCRRCMKNDVFDAYYEKLYKVLFNDGDIRWKIENRLLKFYKDRF